MAKKVALYWGQSSALYQGTMMLNSPKTFSIPVDALGISDVEVIHSELTRANEFIIMENDFFKKKSDMFRG
ncbi:MAG: hypothetical protein K2Q14_00160 [Gammaproteobacteria bacterium]|nr:hypothetical protein [Gammaproteobacteria bacterium]